jgi:hypothetical protein
MAWGSAGTESLRHFCPYFQAPFNVLVNAGFDDSTEFFVFQIRAIFFDQSPELIKQEVVAFDAVIKSLERVLSHSCATPA